MTVPEYLMVESVGLVSTPVEEHKHGGGSREEKDLALIINILPGIYVIIKKH